MARTNLFTSFAEIAAYYPFADSLDFASLLPTLKQVERKFIKNELDTATWGLLLKRLDEPNPEDVEYTALSELACAAAASLVALFHLAKANVHYGASGLLVMKTENMVPASDARTINLKLQLFKDVQNALDEMFEYLEANTAVFTDWAASDKRIDYRSLIIPTAKEFEFHYTISESNFIFRKLVSSQRLVIDREVKAALGEEFVQAWINRQISGPSESDLSIANDLKRAVAYLTMAEAIPRLQMQFGPEGIALFDSQYQTMLSRRLDTDFTRIKFLQNDALAKGKGELMALKCAMDELASADMFSEYFTSSAYTDPETDVTDLNDDPDRNYHAV